VRIDALTTTDLVAPARALLSVSDKAGLLDLARALHALGCELVSTGGTARALADAGLPVTPIDALTGFPEMMDGRVKTLHPRVHGGLLALRDNPAHLAAMTEHGIRPIDLVVINLYPFEKTVASGHASDDEAIEQIDIGGPSMIRSAAKNHRSVAVLTDPAQYGPVIDELRSAGGTRLKTRQRLAVEALERTGAYDAVIARELRTRLLAPESPEHAALPAHFARGYHRLSTLRYGENPHQAAAVYADPVFRGPSVIGATQLAGKELSFNNLADAAAALELVQALDRLDRTLAAACVVKHTNPCGAAEARTAAEACRLAIAGDPLAAFGGILACSHPVDAAAAAALVEAGSFFEVLVAPGFEPAAVATLSERWKNCRLLAVGTLAHAPEPVLSKRFIPGGVLVQERDRTVPSPGSWTHAAGPTPTPADLRAAAALECIGRALSSNAVCLGGHDGDPSDKRLRLFGAGAGQMDRVAACRNAIEKAGDRARGSIAYSDAFFPFPDGPQLLIDAGVRVLVHPGGSKRDQDTFDLCNARGVTCLTTGVRHFRH
jgi:phosphoribosylaminoimidazolecarboxamide formyltransferase/IMP cyclohydrolase